VSAARGSQPQIAHRLHAALGTQTIALRERRDALDPQLALLDAGVRGALETRTTRPPRTNLLADAVAQREARLVDELDDAAGFDELIPETLATATVDRLLHHAHVPLTDRTDSYRLAQGRASFPFAELRLLPDGWASDFLPVFSGLPR
jgi:hypothetical protein